MVECIDIKASLSATLGMEWKYIKNHLRALTIISAASDPKGRLVTNYGNMQMLIAEGLILATHIPPNERVQIAYEWGLTSTLLTDQFYTV